MPRFKELTQHFSLYLKDSQAMYKLSKRVYPGTKISVLIKRRKFEFHLLKNYRYYLELKSLFNKQKLNQISQAYPRIFDKVNRPYLVRGAKPEQRFQILDSNYRFVEGAFSNRLIRSIFIDQDFLLCDLPFPEEYGKIATSLIYESKFEREGEFTIALHDEAKRLLYSISFSLNSTGQTVEALVGCVQGGMPLTEIKQMTKALEGVRPPNLLVFLLRVFCQHFKISRLRAVGFQAQVYCETHKHAKIRFDYDSFWQELGGVQSEQGLFSIPVEHSRKPISEIRSNKRASYSRRYALLDGLEGQIQRALFEHAQLPSKIAC